MTASVKFTRPDGRPCFVIPEKVEEVTPATGTGHDNASTVIVEDGVTQYVTEELDDVLRKLGML